MVLEQYRSNRLASELWGAWEPIPVGQTFLSAGDPGFPARCWSRRLKAALPHGLRRARYRGLAKVRLQNYLIGGACNLNRWLRRLAWGMRQTALTTSLSAASGAN